VFPVPISAHSLWQGARQEVLNEQLQSASFSQRLEVIGWQKDPPTFVKWTRESRAEKEPCVWCQVLALTLPRTKPEFAVSTTRQSVQ